MLTNAIVLLEAKVSTTPKKFQFPNPNHQTITNIQIPITQKLFGHWLLKFIKTASENPVLWTGMKDASAKGRKDFNQMLKQVQHDNGVWISCFVIPNLFRDLGFWFREFGF